MTPLVFMVTVISRDASWTSPKSIGDIFLLYGPFAYFAEGLIGLPTFLIYRFLNWKSLIAFCCGGALVAILADLLISRLFISWRVSGGDFGWSMLAGAISALAFRLILGRAFIDRKSVAIRTEI